MHILRLRWMLISLAAFAVAMAVYAAGAAKEPSKKKPVAARPTRPQRTTKVQRALATTPATTPAPAPIGVAPVKPRGTDAPNPPSEDDGDREPTALDPEAAAQADAAATPATDEPAADEAADDETATDGAAPTKPAAKQPADGVERFDLQYKFKPGEVIRTEVTHRATVETTIKGTTQVAETRTTSIKIWQISPASTPLQFAFIHGVESIDMWQHTKGREEVAYNSQTDATPPPGYEEVAKAVGVPLSEMVIDNRGKVLKRKELHAQSSANPAPVTMPLPEKPVAIGESWTHPLELDVLLANGGGTKKIQARQKFTLESVKVDVATIQVDSDALTAVNDPAIEAQLIQRMPSGTIRFDIEAGRVLSQQMDVDKRVIGFNGPASSMHFLSRFSEEFKSATPATASRAKARK